MPEPLPEFTDAVIERALRCIWSPSGIQRCRRCSHCKAAAVVVRLGAAEARADATDSNAGVYREEIAALRATVDRLAAAIARVEALCKLNPDYQGQGVIIRGSVACMDIWAALDGDD